MTNTVLWSRHHGRNSLQTRDDHIELLSLKQDAEGKYVDTELAKTRRIDKVEERTRVGWLIGAAA